MHVPASEFAAPAVVPGGPRISRNGAFTPRTRCLQIGPIIGSMSIALWVIVGSPATGLLIGLLEEIRRAWRKPKKATPTDQVNVR